MKDAEISQSRKVASCLKEAQCVEPSFTEPRKLVILSRELKLLENKAKCALDCKVPRGVVAAVE